MELRPYQKEDVEFLKGLQAAGCFNEQRTGKTPTALMTVKAKGLADERVLVITTSSALFIWQDEYERWLGKPCSVVAGTPTRKKKIISEWTHGLIISLGSLKETAKNPGYLPEILKMNPQMVIFDEAHNARNTETRAFASIHRLVKIPHKLALTGTPAYGRQYDIFAVLSFLYPNVFRSKYSFLNEYFDQTQTTIWTKDSTGRPMPRVIKEYTNFKKGKDLELQRFLDSHCTQRKRKDVMQWLPEKDKQIIRLPQTDEQIKSIKELMETFETGDVVTQGVLDRLTRVRQICVDPTLLGIKSASPKTQFILDYIQDNPDTPVIIFSNFTAYLWKLTEELHNKRIKYAMIVGDVSPNKRAIFQKDFQSGKFNVFLINIQAGKEALTLDRAEAMIFTDAYAPVGAMEQAEDRFIATSEKFKDKPHTIYYLTMKDSFEEHIIDLLQQRKTETEIINDFRNQLNNIRR